MRREISERLKSVYGTRDTSPTPRHIQEAIHGGDQPFSKEIFLENNPEFFRSEQSQEVFKDVYDLAKEYLKNMKKNHQWQYDPDFFEYYVHTYPNIFLNKESGEILFAKFGDRKTFKSLGDNPPMERQHAYQFATSVFGKLETSRKNETKSARKDRKNQKTR